MNPTTLIVFAGWLMVSAAYSEVAAQPQPQTARNRVETTARTADGKKPHLVFVIGENEYQTWETLPEFAKKELAERGFRSSFVTAPPKGGNDFENIDAIKTADLLFVSTRRRTPQKEMMDLIRRHLDAGKPLVAIRTASHGFDAQPPDERHAAWPNFDREVLGGHYLNHYGNNLLPTLRIPATSAQHPILSGITTENFRAHHSLYRSRELVGPATPLLTGSIMVDGREVTEPVAWANTQANRRVFYTSLGGPEDFKEPGFRRLLLNGILWALNEKIAPPAAGATPNQSKDQSGPLSPAESLRRFQVADDLEIEQVLAEPIVAQPVSLSFDERGRLWVVQYRQYPDPAGLKMLSRDNFWRAVYDKIPPPPPHHIPGRDRITIHEDTDGDGTFDKHKTFLDGLNIATAVARGRGGVWVLNPPYLMFYPDRNNDDVPDGDPVVHLAGFGLEDTHSVANSLRWGPDGWLYGAQGSTVTGNMIRPELDKDPLHTMGQLIWRYHPETKRFEVFAEGGGNAFGVEIDSKGRVFSGHNGGNTRGFHYVQGGYLQKGFNKHGPLSNPYAFGYFQPMTHPNVERFTHTFLIYDGGALPGRYDGKLFGVEPLQGRVVQSDFQPNGSSFKTVDLGHPVTTTDKWFRPVDIKVGPDGAIYVADWYDGQVNHYRNHEGLMDSSNGRVYRIKAKGAKPIQPFDLGRLSNEKLIEWLGHKNEWFRQTALRLLADRRDATVIPALRRSVESSRGQFSLEAFWALHLSGGFNDDLALQTLDHPDPYVRLWTARLLADAKSVSTPLAQKLANVALAEPHVEVRSQLASSAKRLPAHDAFPIVRNLLTHAEDTKDIYVPLLLWWAIEAKAETDRDAVADLFADARLWQLPLVQEHILERLMRRYAQAGTRKDLLVCARVLRMAPGPAQTARLMAGFEEAFKGRSLAALPDELIEALAQSGGGSLALQVRLGRGDAVTKALTAIADNATKRDDRLPLIQVFGEVKQPASVPVLLKLAAQDGDSAFRKAALTALQPYDDFRIAPAVVSLYRDLPEGVRPAAQTLLASRAAWARQLLEAVDRGGVPKDLVPLDVVRKIEFHKDPQIAQLVAKHWNPSERAAGAEKEKQIKRLAAAIHANVGNPYKGKQLFNAACASCHKLFEQGGQVGPDLTTYKRDDVETMLLNVINPNAEIREGFENYVVATKDERTLTGFLADQDNRVVVLRGIDGQNIVLNRGEIAEMKSAGMSLMPEGLLDALDETQVRDLFAYLRSTQPLND